MKGSPPRMRGKVVWLCLGLVVTGITPAYAGKSVTAQQDFIIDRDHPRVCGEKYSRSTPNLGIEGSPPRMRGKGSCGRAAGLSVGITPAYAGKSTRRKCMQQVHGDHPRVCGEKGISAFKGYIQEGSPPRMRGKADHRRGGEGCHGITPAYAGKRKPWSQCSWCDRDHPRVCGEKT